MPVGTLGAVKGLTPGDLEQAGASVMLANLYHLSLRPGVEAIERLGGLHAFTGWTRLILTDSGGFQVFSLAALSKITDDGVKFRSHLDGSALELTPESVVRAQEAMGVDLAMVLDECPPWPVSEERARAALERTLRWAERSLAARSAARDTALFGTRLGVTRARTRAARRSGATAVRRLRDRRRECRRAPRERREVEHGPALHAERPRYLDGCRHDRGSPARRPLRRRSCRQKGLRASGEERSARRALHPLGPSGSTMRLSGGPGPAGSGLQLPGLPPPASRGPSCTTSTAPESSPPRSTGRCTISVFTLTSWGKSEKLSRLPAWRTWPRNGSDAPRTNSDPRTPRRWTAEFGWPAS
ncbi:MAG: tRNA guanosine(34) transglycosylase Tgt [Thermoanaerobaculia bacterium]